jgi:predicted  nucleic acid-binding Zn-ribbon protein
MTEITWVAVVGVLLLVSQILNLINSTATVKKNANAPLEAVRADVMKNKEEIGEIKHALSDVKKDIDHAFDKIRENKEESERTAKAQNAALVQILLLLKEPTNKNDVKIDETIKQLTSI